MKKTCSKCHSIKRLEEFHNKSSSVDGRDSRCKSCVKHYKKKHNQKLKSIKNKQITISSNLDETKEVSTEFYIQLLDLQGDL